jgi:hypothetical protein
MGSIELGRSFTKEEEGIEMRHESNSNSNRNINTNTNKVQTAEEKQNLLANESN